MTIEIISNNTVEIVEIGVCSDGGQGVPAGGTAGQILSKIDETDYNTQWEDAPSNDGDSSTPSLQAVTDVGYVTTNPVFASGAVIVIDSDGPFPSIIGMQISARVPTITAANNGVTTSIDFSNRVAGTKSLKIPDASNGSTLVATVNGVAADVNGNVNINASGQTALAAGTKSITVPGVTTSSTATVSQANGSSDALTVKYQIVCTFNTITINAITSAGNNTVNTADVSTINYSVVY